MSTWIEITHCKTCQYNSGIDTEHPDIGGNKFIPKCIFDSKVKHLRYGPFTHKVLCPRQVLLSQVGIKSSNSPKPENN
jgi:hypothetical protein